MLSGAIRAWVLTEGYDCKPEEIVGIALTNQEASAWVHANSTPGYARTSHPYPLVPRPTELAPVAKVSA